MNYELLTNINTYEKEALQIRKLAYTYGVSEAIIMRSLINSADNETFDSAVKWFSINKKNKIER